MIQVSIHEAKTQLSKLIQKTLNGEDVFILKRSQPIVRLQVIKPHDPTKRIGGLKHSFYKMGENFDNPALNNALSESFYSQPSPQHLIVKKATVKKVSSKKVAAKKSGAIKMPRHLPKRAPLIR